MRHKREHEQNTFQTKNANRDETIFLLDSFLFSVCRYLNAFFFFILFTLISCDDGKSFFNFFFISFQD